MAKGINTQHPIQGLELLDYVVNDSSNFIYGNTDIKVLIVRGMGFESSHILSDFPALVLRRSSIEKACIVNPVLIKSVLTGILEVLRISVVVFAEDLDKDYNLVVQFYLL